MTTEINIDYYEELKAKADKWVEKETPKKITVTQYATFTSESCGNCGKTLWHGTTNYCYHCGQKIDWRLK